MLLFEMRRLSGFTLVALAMVTAGFAQDFRLIRSISGPSGTLQESGFQIEDVRSRFVHPQDKSFVVYFEWAGTSGNHVLSAIWKRPDGQVDSISPEVKVNAASETLKCYWTYTIYPETPSGVWSVEIRIDGQPAGSHPFEIAGTATTRQPPTLDDIFKSTAQSLVWVRKLDSSGRRVDASMGFVIGKDRVATAFQSIDGAAKLEIEFASQQKDVTDVVRAYSRVGDWAIVEIRSGDIPPLAAGDPKSVAIGQRLITFNVEDDAKVIGRVDVAGKRIVPAIGERIQISPAISLAAAGAPLLDVYGKVIGINGGSNVPASRFDSGHMTVSPEIGMPLRTVSAATPLSAIPPALPETASTLSEMASSGVLTAALSDMDGLLYVTTGSEMVRRASDPLPREISEFSKRDKQVWVISEWQRKGKISKGVLSAMVYDIYNRVRVTVEPKKVSLKSEPTRSVFGFALAELEPSVYRIDLLWDSQAVWRAFIRVSD